MRGRFEIFGRSGSRKAWEWVGIGFGGALRRRHDGEFARRRAAAVDSILLLERMMVWGLPVCWGKEDADGLVEVLLLHPLTCGVSK